MLLKLDYWGPLAYAYGRKTIYARTHWLQRIRIDAELSTLWRIRFLKDNIHRFIFWYRFSVNLR